MFFKHRKPSLSIVHFHFFDQYESFFDKKEKASVYDAQNILANFQEGFTWKRVTAYPDSIDKDVSAEYFY